jgi:hypothetical protein
MTPTNSETIWQSLSEEAVRRGAAGIFVQRVFPQSSCDLFLGIEHPSGQRLLIVRVTRNVLPGRDTLPAARGINVRCEALPYDREDRASVIVALRDPRYTDVFSTLVADVADSLAATEDDAAAVQTLLGRLMRWQQFLEEFGPEGLGEEAQRGLYGELLFLRDCVLPATGPAGVTSWTGSRRTAHDFQFPACAVEVKTTTTKQHQRMTIASERQLDDSTCGALYLYLVSLDMLQARGETLNKIVADLRLRLNAHPASLRFEAALLEAGYLDVHASRYDPQGHVVRESRFFRVTGAFPRLTEHDVPAGVGDVRYSVSVAACADYCVSAAEVAEALSRVEGTP